jgi:hypothetical protein
MLYRIAYFIFPCHLPPDTLGVTCLPIAKTLVLLSLAERVSFLGVVLQNLVFLPRAKINILFMEVKQREGGRSPGGGGVLFELPQERCGLGHGIVGRSEAMELKLKVTETCALIAWSGGIRGLDTSSLLNREVCQGRSATPSAHQSW